MYKYLFFLKLHFFQGFCDSLCLSLFTYRKKAKAGGNKKGEGDNEVIVLTPKDSLVLHEAYQFLVKKYIPTQTRAPPKQGQITEKSTIESIKEMKINDKKNNRAKPAANNNADATENTESTDPDSAGNGSPSDQEEGSDDGGDHEEIKFSASKNKDEDQADAEDEDDDE